MQKIPLLAAVSILSAVAFVAYSLVVQATVTFDEVRHVPMPKTINYLNRGLIRELMSLNNELHKTNDEAEKIYQKLKETAARRKQIIETHLSRQPWNFFNLVMAEEERRRLPASLATDLETRIKVRGTIQKHHRDIIGAPEADDYYTLEGEDGVIYDLRFANPLSFFGGSQKVSLQAWKFNQNLYIENEKDIEAISNPTVRVNGAQKTAIVLFNYRDDVSQPTTIDFMRSQVFTASRSVNTLLQETTYGQISLVGRDRPDGDVYGWITIDRDNDLTVCNDLAGLTDQVKQQASSENINLSGYDHIVFFSAQMAGCPAMGGSYSSGQDWSIVNGRTGVLYTAHEMGHWLGANHADAIECYSAGQKVSLSESCQIRYYADPVDMMALSERQMTAYHKGQIGVIDTNSLVTIPASSQSAYYNLGPLEFSNSQPKMLRIPRLYEQFPGVPSQYLYISYRQSSGVFDNFASNNPILAGVSLHLAPDIFPSVFYRSLLVDARPNNGLGSDFQNSVLGVNETFSDPLTGISLSTISTSTSEAIVRVDFSCVHTVPTARIVLDENIDLLAVKPGQSTNYTLQFSNNDNGSCGSSLFNVSTIPPDDSWFYTPSSWLQGVDPVSVQDIRFSIDIPTDAVNGVYSVSHEIENVTAPNFSRSMSSVVFVDGQAPDVTILNPKFSEGGRTVITNPGIIPIHVESYDTTTYVQEIIININGQLLHSCQNSSCLYSWDATPLTNGLYTLEVKALDAASNMKSKTYIFDIRRSSGGKNPGGVANP